MTGSLARRFALPLLIACGLARPLAAQEEAPLAFIETLPAEGQAWASWVERVELRFGVRQDAVEEGLVSMYRREMDLPVRVDLSAWRDASEIQIYPLLGAAEGGKSFVLDGELVRATPTQELRDGVAYETYTLPVLIEFGSAPRNQGFAWEVDPVTLVLHYASEFEEDFLGDRIAVNPQRFAFDSAPLRREVRVPPTSPLAGSELAPVRGPTELEARLETGTVERGEEFSVEVIVRGEFLGSTPPLAPEGEGWTWLGQLELEAIGDPLTHTMRFRFDGRAEQPGSWTLPPFRMLRFDPDEEAYVADESGSLALEVTGAATAAPQQGPKEPQQQTGEEDAGTAAEAQPLPFWIPALLGAGLLALAAWARQTMRQNVAAREAQAFERIERAAAAQQDSVEPLQLWLAARLDWPRARLSGPGTARRLQEAGIEPALAEQLAAFLAEAEAARYGGPPLADAAARRETLRRAWDAATKT